MLEGGALQYRAFISYSHADAHWAKWLHAALERFAIDKDIVGRVTEMGPVPESLRPIFLDRDEFLAGLALSEQTNVVIDASAALIVICSLHAARSHYVNEEVRLFKTRHNGRPIIPVIVGDCAGDIEKECFPPALRFVIDVNGTITDKSVGLLAADARDEGDGRNLALAKVVARLVGLSTDEIFRRTERQRRVQRRIRAGFAAVLLMLLIGGGILAWRDQQWQLTVAEVKARIADYGITDAYGADKRASLRAAVDSLALGARNEPRNKEVLELMRAGKTAEAELLLETIAADVVVRVGRANKDAAAVYRQLGAIAGLGDPRRARAAYATALTFDPDDTESLYWHGLLNFREGNLRVAELSLQRLMAIATRSESARDLYRAHLRLGEIDLARGNLAAAIKQQRKAAAIAETAIQTNPADIEWQRDYSISLEKIGDVIQAQGNFSAALKSFEDSLAIRDRLTRQDPSKAEWQQYISVSKIKIGDVLLAQDDLMGALEKYNTAFGIRDRFSQQAPRNVAGQRDLATSHDTLGAVLQLQLNPSAALQRYEASLRIREQLVAADPESFEFRRDVSISHDRMGDVMFDQLNLPAALSNYNASFVILDRLTKIDPDNAVWQRDLSLSYNKIGNVERTQGNYNSALKTFELSLAIREHLAKADPENAQGQVDLARSYALIADTQELLGNKVEALRLFKEGRAILAPVAERSGNRNWQGDLRNFDIDIRALEE